MRVNSFALKDCLITDVVVLNQFRATDANTGRAGSLDLFKLYSESTLPNSASGVIEISRVLIQFDMNTFKALTGSELSGTRLNSATFRLKMFDVLSSDTVPSNFHLIVYPLSKTFDEGNGVDSYAFQDLGAANFMTASGKASTAVTWSLSGANQPGYYKQANIDFITGSDSFPGKGNTDLFASQSFDAGTENLDIDITTIVSATIVGLLPDFGLRISFSGSEETDSATRFIKRFYSRHANVFSKQPRIEAIFNDSTLNNQSNFIFDTTGTIFLHNTERGAYKNISSGTITLSGNITDVVAANAKNTWAVPIVKLVTGSYSTFRTGSLYETGIYSSSFAIDSLTTQLSGELRASGTVTFNVIWMSADERIPYLTSSIAIKSINREAFIKNTRYRISVSNLKKEYNVNEKAEFRLFIQEVNYSVDSTKLPSSVQSTIINEMYYQIREQKTNDIIFPFDSSNQSTRVSFDKYSNYFNMRMSSFAPGKNYKIEFKLVERDLSTVIDENIVFRVIK